MKGAPLAIAGLLAVAAMALAFNQYSSGVFGPSAEEQLIARAQIKVADRFKDPESAKFRKLRADADLRQVCGEVNAKNSYGAYTGYAPFLYLADTVDISDPDGEPSIGYMSFCSGK